MDKLNFYTVDMRYVDFLKNAEQEKRGFSRVPNMEYELSVIQNFFAESSSKSIV